MRKNFRKLAKIALVLIYLVIIAGAVVRMTGSGMGCPDWPKCFGYYIPPSEESELLFKPNHNYKKGIIIVKDEALWVAKHDFSSANEFSANNWKTYTKHSYAKYNPTHTWIEYINRLVGALSGIPILIFTFLSLFLWRYNKWLTIISILTLFGMGFQAWLGKTVVDSNLAPYKITTHMIMALVIVAFILFLVFNSTKNHSKKKYNKTFNTLLFVAIGLTLIQIAVGTQVRQFIDDQVKLIGYEKAEWLQNPTISFYIHRSFSILVLAINLWLYILNKNSTLHYSKTKWIMYCIALEIVSGIAMYYLDFPFLSQPIHLVIASFLFGIQFYVLLQTQFNRKRVLQIK